MVSSCSSWVWLTIFPELQWANRCVDSGTMLSALSRYLQVDYHSGVISIIKFAEDITATELSSVGDKHAHRREVKVPALWCQVSNLTLNVHKTSASGETKAVISYMTSKVHMWKLTAASDSWESSLQTPSDFSTWAVSSRRHSRYGSSWGGQGAPGWKLRF